MKRTRKDFIDKLVAAGVQFVDAKKIVDLFIKIIQKSLEKGKEVRLKNFGKFVVIKKNEAQFINPKTKKITRIPAHLKVKFIPSKNLKNLINTE